MLSGLVLLLKEMCFMITNEIEFDGLLGKSAECHEIQ